MKKCSTEDNIPVMSMWLYTRTLVTLKYANTMSITRDKRDCLFNRILVLSNATIQNENGIEKKNGQRTIAVTHTNWASSEGGIRGIWAVVDLDSIIKYIVRNNHRFSWKKSLALTLLVSHLLTKSIKKTSTKSLRG